MFKRSGWKLIQALVGSTEQGKGSGLELLQKIHHISTIDRLPLNEIFKYMEKKSKSQAMYEAFLR